MEVEVADECTVVAYTPRGFRWTVGPVVHVTRPLTPSTPHRIHPAGRSPDLMANLADDQRMTLSVQAKDDAGQTIPVPDTVSIAFTTDNPVLNLTDHGDGTCDVQSAPGATPGTTATVTATGTDSDSGQSYIGSLGIAITGGTFAGIEIEAGTPEHV